MDPGLAQQLTSVSLREFKVKSPSDVLLHVAADGDFMVLESDWLAPDGSVVTTTRRVPAVNQGTAMIEVVRNARELADEMAAKKREKLAELIRNTKQGA